MENKKVYLPISRHLNIVLVEDDFDDRLLFEDAIDELPVTVQLTNFSNGDELMEWLITKKKKLPDVLFLDLNMPRKNGFATLAEIKKNPYLESLPVFIFSTATNKDMIKQVYKDAALYYIRKPVHFEELKGLIYKSLTLIVNNDLTLPRKDNFMLTID